MIARSFPRYSVANYQLKFILKSDLELKQSDVSIIEVSLGGLKIKANKNINTNDFKEIFIGYNKYKFKLDITKMWTEDVSDTEYKVCGFSTSFKSFEDYQLWLRFIKSLHLLKQKNKAKK